MTGIFCVYDIYAKYIAASTAATAKNIAVLIRQLVIFFTSKNATMKAMMQNM